MVSMILFAKQKQRHRHREQMHEYQEGKVGGGRNWEIGIDTYTLLVVASVVAYRSVVSNSLKPQAHQASLSFTISQSLLKLMSIESMMTSNHLVLCHPLLLLPSVFPSIRFFAQESAFYIRWPKYLSISPSKEHSGLISFVMNWFDLLAVQGMLKSLLQFHSSKASILWLYGYYV